MAATAIPLERYGKNSATKSRSNHGDPPGGSRRKSTRDGTIPERRRFSITLSDKSAQAFDWLKETTDADTDSEVIRNALRLHFVLLQQSLAGRTFHVRGKDGKLTEIDLFVAK